VALIMHHVIKNPVCMLACLKLKGTVFSRFHCLEARNSALYNYRNRRETATRLKKNIKFLVTVNFSFKCTNFPAV